MFTKQIFALFLWCHFYPILLNPILQFLTGSSNQQALLYNGQTESVFKTRFVSVAAFLVSGSPITVEANQVALTPGRELVLRCNVTEYPDLQFAWFRRRIYPRKENQAPEMVEEELKPFTINNGHYTQSSSLDRDQAYLNDQSYAETSSVGATRGASSGSDSNGMESKASSMIIDNNVIKLKSPTYSDVGDYYCRLKVPRDDVESEKKILVRAQPFIDDFRLESSTLLSASVEEGKPLKIPCNVYEYFEPESNVKINWHVSKFDDESDVNEVISGEDGIRIENYNSTSQALVFDKVTKAHRKFYKCHVTNGITENSKTIYIRVKDKHDVIWPTVGIVVELLILIGVICVVENRKVEPDRVNYDRKVIQM